MDKTAPIKISKRKSDVYGLGVTVKDKKIILYYRSNEDPKHIFHAAISLDGFSFSKDEKDCFIQKDNTTSENITKSYDFRISKQGDYYLLTYVFGLTKPTLEKAWSKDLFTFEYEGRMLSLDKKCALVSDYLFLKNHHVIYCADDTITTFLSNDLIKWKKQKSIGEIKKRFPKAETMDISYAACMEKGILVVYHIEIKGMFFAYVALFDLKDPSHLLWTCNDPIWITPTEWQQKSVYPIGVVIIENKIIAYWQTDKDIYAAVYGLYKISDGVMSKDISLKLKRTIQNPIISPSKNSWEAFNTFNPAAIYDDGKVHILYRAQGYDYVSTIGYATSKDGIHIDERLDKPIYAPSQGFEDNGGIKPSYISYSYVSGGGYGGCEDPRITRIDNRYYLTYVAFDGVNPPRVALTSISVDNFLNRRFLWEKPVLISPPNVVDKSAVLFPEKIRGKYAILHRIYPDILLDYVDNLNFDGTKWLEGKYKISPRADKWDSRKIGAGAPPIKTKYGWLLIYQSVGEQDSGRYKIGAMILDLTHPEKVLYRCQSPILEPEAVYENDGFKAGVIYPCGAVVISDTLYVYYGGADSYVCVATANLEEFLKELMFSEVAKLTTPIVEKIF